MKKQKEESLIHLRFNYSDAKNSKKDILSTELNLLRIAQSMKNYEKLRLQELKTKEKIQLKLKSTKSDLSKLIRELPVVKIPKILKREEKKTLSKTEERPSSKIETYGTIEDQLKDIQKRLNALSKEDEALQ